MPRPRFAKLPTEKQQRILRAAARAFAEHGLEGASLNQIIEQAGVSKGAVYYYFDDKADLLVTVLADLWHRSIGPIELEPGRLTAETFWPDVQAWLINTLEAVALDPVNVGVGKLFYRLPPGLIEGTALEAELHAARDLLETLVCRGQELGVVRTDLPLGLLLALIAGAAEAGDRWAAEHWEQLEERDAMAISLRMLELLRTMASPPPEAAEATASDSRGAGNDHHDPRAGDATSAAPRARGGSR